MSIDRHRRRMGTESAADAVTRALERAGLPVPASLDAIMDPSRDDLHERAQAAVRPVSRRARMLELGWPLRAVDFAEDARDTPAIAAIRRWDGTSIVLAGKKGTGKTVAAAWYALRRTETAVVRFARAATLVRIGRFSEQWQEILSARALCIDDLGAEYADVKGSFVSDLDELVDTFYSDRRALIITSNLDGKEFRSRYGARVIDRLYECATWASIEGESLRRPSDDAPPWEEE